MRTRRMKHALGGVFGLEPVREAYAPPAVQDNMKRIGLAFGRARAATVDRKWRDLERLADDIRAAAEKLKWAAKEAR